MSYTKPQALVFQEFRIIPAEVTEPLRAHISGPHAELHRYSDADEKPLINLGEYDPLVATCYSWPGRAAGSLVDTGYVKLFIDDALLLYLEDLIGVDSTIAPVSGKTNRVRSDSLSFKANGDSFTRSASLFDRDVALGDTVKIHGLDGADELELVTTVRGFAAEEVEASVGAAAADADNADSQTLAVAITKTGGPANCITATADGSEYDGLIDGDASEVYTVTVITSSTSGDFTTARLRVTSASGNDNVSSVTPGVDGAETAIGARGLKVTFSSGVGVSCSSAADLENVSPNELIVGQKWQVSVSQPFEKAHARSGGSYDGDIDDTYIVEVTRGGSWADGPKITVTTTKGLDFSGPTTVNNDNVEIPIGSHNVTVQFFGTGQDSSSSSGGEGAGGAGWGGGSLGLDPVNGLRKGDKFYIPVTSAAEGRIATLILAHDLPEGLQDATDLDLYLYIKDDIQVVKNRTGFAPLVNWENETTQICVQDGIIAYDSSWTDDGVELPLNVMGGTLYVEYREWLSTLTDTVGSINDVADLDDIPGPLDADNTLKWGVYKALLNSNGTAVKYTSVADPDDLDDWIAALARIKGNDTLYNLVPLTYNSDVKDAYLGQADAESSAEEGNWKGVFFAHQGRTSTAAVSADTSVDGKVVLATLTDDPNSTGTQYTLLTVTDGNGQFITNNVAPGDIVRYLYTTDGFDTAIYNEFTVDSVLSENSLLLLTGHTSAINVPQKIEIWHNLTKDEMAAEFAAAAAAYSNRRCCLVQPGAPPSDAAITQPYFLAAALAGEVSGVVPHQGLTNVELLGMTEVVGDGDYFNSAQLDIMAGSGVWLVVKDRDGAVITRHALTTDMSDLNHREEMVRRNVDSMSFLFLRRASPYIGRANASPSMIDVLEAVLDNTITFFKSNGFTQELGSQLIDGKIRQLYIHPIELDRIVAVLDLTVPAPLNFIEIHLVL